MSTTPSNNALHFEEALQELEAMIAKMASGQLTLEDALKNFESGISLARRCQEALTSAEQKVQILIEQNGQRQLGSFIEEG